MPRRRRGSKRCLAHNVAAILAVISSKFLCKLPLVLAQCIAFQPRRRTGLTPARTRTGPIRTPHRKKAAAVETRMSLFEWRDSWRQPDAKKRASAENARKTELIANASATASIALDVADQANDLAKIDDEDSRLSCGFSEGYFILRDALGERSPIRLFLECGVISFEFRQTRDWHKATK